LKYIIIIHDYGKLNILWQNIVNDYQKEKSKSNNGDFNSNFLAHTDYDPNSKGDLEMMKKIFKEYKVRRKPSHAGIGAFLTKCILPFLLKMEKNSENHSLLKVVITTIARHHSANTKTFPEYEIDNDAISLINDKLMKSIIPKFQISDVSKFPFSKYSKGNLESDIIQFNNKIETFLYFILVRALRLCDQRSFAENNKLEKNNE
jgi:CRISPR-associated endonuclease/helicase Cas3